MEKDQVGRLSFSPSAQQALDALEQCYLPQEHFTAGGLFRRTNILVDQATLEELEKAGYIQLADIFSIWRWTGHAIF